MEPPHGAVRGIREEACRVHGFREDGENRLHSVPGDGMKEKQPRLALVAAALGVIRLRCGKAR